MSNMKQIKNAACITNMILLHLFSPFTALVRLPDDKMLELKKFKFDVLFSGDDWKGSDRYLRTEKQFAEYGASIEYLPYTKGISTTDIKNKMKEK